MKNTKIWTKQIAIFFRSMCGFLNPLLFSCHTSSTKITNCVELPQKENCIFVDKCDYWANSKLILCYVVFFRLYKGSSLKFMILSYFWRIHRSTLSGLQLITLANNLRSTSNLFSAVVHSTTWAYFLSKLFLPLSFPIICLPMSAGQLSSQNFS